MTTITQYQETNYSAVSLQARIPSELLKKLRVRAAERGCYPRDLVVEALKSYFETTDAVTPS